mgnify:CR=1 FL=1
MKEKKKEIRKTSIGGQALMEGIMMRGPEKSAMAVRRPNGEIFFEEHENPQKKRPKICRLPIIRGVFGFADSMVTGYKYLMRSAEIACEEVPEKGEEKPAPAESTPAAPTEKAAVSGDVPAEAPSPKPESAAKAEAAPEPESAAKAESAAKEESAAKAESAAGTEPKSAFGKGAMTGMMLVATVLGVALAIGLFVWLPTFLYTQLAKILPAGAAENRYLRSAFEGALKIAVLVAYMALVSLMKDIRRTFMYHGAEHKTIFCYEHGLPLTVENVRGERRYHPRCGTSFLILMLLVSIVVGIFIPPTMNGINPTAYTFIRTAIKILLIPLVMGIGYELLKFAGRHDNILTKIISAPGMWLQHLTVKEPTDDMIECAITAFKAVIPPDESDKW